MTDSRKKIICIGVNHESAPVQTREKIAIAPNLLGDASRSLRQSADVDEVVLLSTCNRTEIYCFAGSPQLIAKWLENYFGLLPGESASYSYIFEDGRALEHLAHVACGMDSMVLGESQILGQLKDAYRQAGSVGALGPKLHRVFQCIFSLAKDIRTNTSIGEHSVSLASVCLRTSRHIYGELNNLRVLFVGAGEMIRICAEYFSKHQFKELFFCNRTESNAQKLATRFAGGSAPLSALPSVVGQFDVIVTCTGSQLPIFGKGLLERASRERKHKPILIFDMAVPRDVDEEVEKLDDLFLFSIDDLGRMANDGYTSRQAEATAAQQIIRDAIEDLNDRLISDECVGVVKAYRNFGLELANRELQKAVDALKRSEDPEDVLRSFTNALTKKFLDRPSRALNSARGDDRKKLSVMLAKLFDLDEKI